MELIRKIIIVLETNDTVNTHHISILRYQNGEVVVTNWESDSLHIDYQIKDDLLIQTRAHMGGWEYNVHKITENSEDIIESDSGELAIGEFEYLELEKLRKKYSPKDIDKKLTNDNIDKYIK